MISGSSGPRLVVLTEARIEILVSGLASLEGALRAIQQPLPVGLSELRAELHRQKEALALAAGHDLTTKAVAVLLNCSPSRVHQLGKQNLIRLVCRGGRGRGHSNLYDGPSVCRYLDQNETERGHVRPRVEV